MRTQGQRDLARRAVPGALVYALVIAVIAVATPFYKDHRAVIVSTGILMLALGLIRLVASRHLAGSSAETLHAWSRLFRALLFVQFLAWGLFCATTVAFYGKEWPSMLVLLCTASLAGGGAVSLAPDRQLGVACMLGMMVPGGLAAAGYGIPETYAIAFLDGVYIAFLLIQAKQQQDSYWTTSVAAAREAESEADRLFRAAFEGAGVGMALLDEDGRFLRANAKLSNIFDVDPLELTSPELASFSHPENSDLVGETLERLRGGENHIHFEQRFLSRSGEEVWGTVDITVVGPRGGNDAYLVAMIQDITDVKQAEQEKARMTEQLRESQKMEAVGKLAGGIAHDFNNSLAVIMTSAELALEDIQENNPARQTIASILKASERAADMVRHLLAFSRRQVLRSVVVNLNDVVSEMQDWLQRTIGEDIEIKFDLDPKLMAVSVDPSQIQQAVLNLVVNARDAMPSGGRLSIRTENRQASGSSVLGSASPGGEVLLTVSDTGHGMDEVTNSRIFEPFFTTKEAGQGTGLGLATTYGIIQQCGGTIRCESSPSNGAVFEILLPAVVNYPASLPAEKKPKKVSEQRTGRILVVEDESSLRLAMRHVLSRNGYGVIEAANGAEALAVLRNSDDSIDLVLTDVIMPSMSGPELVSALRSRRPDLPVIFMSAYAGERLTEQGVKCTEHEFIQKPFTLEKLLNKIRYAFDQSGDRPSV